MSFLYYLCLLLLVRSGWSMVAPDYNNLCSGLSEKSDCLKKLAQDYLPILLNGIPSIGVPVLDPMELPPSNFLLTGDMEISFWNGTLNGLRKCQVDTFTYEENEGEINVNCDLTIKGLYKMKGKVLIFDLNGDGDLSIRTSLITLHGKVSFEDVVKNGVTYHEIKDVSVTYEYPGRVIFRISDLLSGNPLLSDLVLSYLNENWQVVANELGTPFVDYATKEVVSNIKKFFSAIPKEELFKLWSAVTNKLLPSNNS